MQRVMDVKMRPKRAKKFNFHYGYTMKCICNNPFTQQGALMKVFQQTASCQKLYLILALTSLLNLRYHLTALRYPRSSPESDHMF